MSKQVAAGVRDEAEAFSPDAPAPTCPCQDPHKKLFVGIFFDGTNNNKDRDLAASPPHETNVVRLWQVYKEGAHDGGVQHKKYIDGVGSLDTDKRKAQAAQEIKENTRWYNPVLPTLWSGAKLLASLGADVAGKAGGLGGKERLNRAYFWLKDRCGETPLQGAKKVDVYGFSRGAALARTFVNLVHEALKDDFPTVEVRFLGIYDTVGSFGVGGDNSNPGQNMYITSASARAVAHFVARHEYRANFPLTATDGGDFDLEYPGAHSDVGGGYPDGEDGRKNHLAWIPCVDMWEASQQVEVWSDKPSSPIDIEALRKESDEKAGPATKDRKAARTPVQVKFFEEYVHESAKSWNLAHHFAKDEVRVVLTESKYKLTSKPPDFEWEEQPSGK